eukprot:CAMPEP_0116041874 /NCGR_PEP_ID=MMETSP0321-20121206/25334_1 /TAXON_ID=163516 /ORGANISM="Leptocylindrus danicus var. danicus, Strain B650" /LENGTH=365 /DNA_ID=CAMNT_0003522203 /DNA_START=1938 /DNA_END=3035 /DNA_ORIENTATION=+
MASRLKQSSIAMNESLKAQNENVNRMAELTERNLDDVTNVAGNVEERLRKRGWLKTFGTWSLVFVIIGSFVGLFMVMRVVPKRKNICVVFWCDDDSASDVRPRRDYASPDDRFSGIASSSLLLSSKDYSDDDDDSDDGGGETAAASTVMSSASSSSSSIGDDANNGHDVHGGDCDAAIDGECEVTTSHNLDEDEDEEEDATEEEEEDVEIEEFVCNDIGDCNKMEAVEEQIEPPPEVTTQNQQEQQEQHHQEYVHTVTEEQYTAAQLYVEMKKAAIDNDLNQLSQLLQMHHGLEAMNSKDVNGWQIMHEISRAGNVAVVRLLHVHGADINEVSNFGRGATPLALARQRFGDHHPVVSYLQSNGAV